MQLFTIITFFSRVSSMLDFFHAQNFVTLNYFILQGEITAAAAAKIVSQLPSKLIEYQRSLLFIHSMQDNLEGKYLKHFDNTIPLKILDTKARSTPDRGRS